MATADGLVFGEVFPIPERVFTEQDRSEINSLLRPSEPFGTLEGGELAILPKDQTIFRRLGEIARSGLEFDPTTSLFRVILLRGNSRIFSTNNRPFRRTQEEGDLPEQTLYCPIFGHLLTGKKHTDTLHRVNASQLVVMPHGSHAIEVPPEALVLGLSYRG